MMTTTDPAGEKIADAEADAVVRRLHLLWVSCGMGATDAYTRLYKRYVERSYPLLDPDYAVQLAESYEMKLRRELGSRKCTYEPPVYGWVRR